MIQATPPSFDGRPELWPLEDRRLLEGSSVEQTARSYWRYIKSQFKRVRRGLKGPARVSLRDFVWGYQASATRTFSLNIDGTSTSGLVPLAEMFNHAVEHNCDWGGDHTREFCIRTKRAIAKGEELTITYGKVPSHRLLAQYGFCLPHNPHDTALLSFPLDEGHWLRAFRQVTEGGTPRREIGRDPALADGPAILTLLRLWSLPNEDAIRADARIDPKLAKPVPFLGAANERSALLRLIDACERSLAGYPDSLAHDDQLLASGSLGWRQTMAVTARRNEKRILHDTLANARSALVALSLPEPECLAAISRRAAEGGLWSGYFRALEEGLMGATALATAA
jgi:hypothetical protein